MRALARIVVTAMLLTLTATPVQPSVVFAGTQGNCSPEDEELVLAFENEKGTTTGGNDAIWICSNISDLGNVSHNLPGECGGTRPPWVDNWNDCIKSFTYLVPQNRKVCIYTHANYQTLQEAHNGPLASQRIDVATPWPPTISSIKFQNVLTSC